MVVTNRHRQTGVVTKQGSKLVHCVLMDSAGITVTHLSKEQFTEDWKEIPYDTRKAIEKLIAAGKNFGITSLAMQQLSAL